MASDVPPDVFLAEVAHELRTPLGALVGFTEILEAEPSRITELIGPLRRNALHLASLVSDVLDLSKTRSDHLTVVRESVDIAEEVESVLAMFSTEAARKGVGLTARYLDLAPETVETVETVETDRTRFRQILINVIGNAVKFTDAGTVDVTVERSPGRSRASGGQIVITVRDTGDGIAREHHSRVFEPFARASDATRRGREGSGIGLVLSRNLARLLGGDVVLKQSAPGVGSSFEIRIDGGAAAAPLAPPSSYGGLPSSDGDLSSSNGGPSSRSGDLPSSNPGGRVPGTCPKPPARLRL